MKKWLLRLSPAVVMAAVAILAPTSPADCQDCKPAPEKWRCAGEWESCPLYDEYCKKLKPPGTE